MPEMLRCDACKAWQSNLSARSEQQAGRLTERRARSTREEGKWGSGREEEYMFMQRLSTVAPPSAHVMLLDYEFSTKHQGTDYLSVQRR